MVGGALKALSYRNEEGMQMATIKTVKLLTVEDALREMDRIIAASNAHTKGAKG